MTEYLAHGIEDLFDVFQEQNGMFRNIARFIIIRLSAVIIDMNRVSEGLRTSIEAETF